LGLILALSGPRPVEGADRNGEEWPRFLGPDANNTSSETGLLTKWPTSGPALLWEKEVGSGYSAPSVRGDQLVLHHRIGGDEIGKLFRPPPDAGLALCVSERLRRSLRL
jgi:hypothetical protein